MAKGNKAAARDWHEEQQRAKRDETELCKEAHALWYCAHKRKGGMPLPGVFREQGYGDVADKIEEAYAAFEEAYRLLVRRQQGGGPAKD